jgi:hypothetical protein
MAEAVEAWITAVGAKACEAVVRSMLHVLSEAHFFSLLPLFFFVCRRNDDGRTRPWSHRPLAAKMVLATKWRRARLALLSARSGLAFPRVNGRSLTITSLIAPR